MRQIVELCGSKIRISGSVLKTARLEGDGFEFLDNPDAVISLLRQHDARVDVFTFIQKITTPMPMFKYPLEWDNLAALPISSFDHWWTEQIGFKARNKAKQAEKKGISVREVPFDDSLVEGIYEIYNECPIRQGRRFPHYGKNVDQVREETATFLERSIFIGAFLREKLIGFTKLVVDEGGTQAATMNILSMVAQRDKAPTNALIAQAVRSCADRKIGHLVYSRYVYGKREHSTISDFKERNGFQKFDVPRYYVPLTTKGHIALRFGLHKDVVGLLPEALLARLRGLRSMWHTRRFQAAKEPA
jgi:hypothetical protein